MADYTAHNSKVFKVGLKNFAEREIKAKLEAMLRDVAKKLVDAIDGAFVPFEQYGGGTEKFPVWEGQLHDATGVGVYINGRLSSYMPTKKGFDEQVHGDIDGIIGSEYLQQALNEATSQFPTGIWIVLFSAVPYAYKVNEYGSPRHRGKGFFESIRSLLIDDVFKGLRPISDIQNPYSLGL